MGSLNSQEKPISESYEVTAPRGLVRAKWDISLHMSYMFNLCEYMHQYSTRTVLYYTVLYLRRFLDF
jgi:hypothetical protein